MAPSAQMAPSAPLNMVFTYHAATKHYPHRFARSLGYMDWDTQPDPFRRYSGSSLIPLDEVPPTTDLAYGAVFQPGAIPPQPLNRATVSQLFYDSLALSAWKEFEGHRWSLRVNPSSGNLHPTEGYLVSGPVPGLLEQATVCHYAPFEHGLEARRNLDPDQWQVLADQLPPGAILVALTSIYWRETWKYGERAFRYCQHDVGHAIGAVVMAAAVLGWESRLLESVADAELATLLGLPEARELDPNEHDRLEAEHPDCLLALYPHGRRFSLGEQRSFRLPVHVLKALAKVEPVGKPNQLSNEHHFWPIIDDVSIATRQNERPEEAFWHQQDAVSIAPTQDQPSAPSARQVIRQRRSAVTMDGVTSVTRQTFFHILGRTLPGQTPFLVLPWRPAIHLALFVHRIEGLAPGLYLLIRDPQQRAALQDLLNPEFLWEKPPGSSQYLDLWLLSQGDYRRAAQAVSCGQDIAGQGVFALGMLAEFGERLRQHGPWFYRRLHWEAGLIGQILYLEAEAASIRATGIGCYFDDSMHQLLGLKPSQPLPPGGRSEELAMHYQTLYHFTAGGPVEDTRLRSLPAYWHRRTDRAAPLASSFT